MHKTQYPEECVAIANGKLINVLIALATHIDTVISMDNPTYHYFVSRTCYWCGVVSMVAEVADRHEVIDLANSTFNVVTEYISSTILGTAKLEKQKNIINDVLNELRTKPLPHITMGNYLEERLD